MTFKLIITQTKVDGTQNKIEVENSKALQNQSELFQFLRPLIREGHGIDVGELYTMEVPVNVIANAPSVAPPEKSPEEQAKEAAENVEKVMVEGNRTITNRRKEEPPEKAVLKEVSVNETGIVQIHCPNCGLETAKHTKVHHTFFPCPTCNTKLFMRPTMPVRGDKNPMGVAFRANSVYVPLQERWEQKYGK